MAPASLATLPLELKARIAQMASWQEDAWGTRVKDTTERAGHINCLSSLALVNKEFRALAAKEQFKVLSSGRALLPIFRYRILPRFGHHFNEVRFMGSDATKDMDTAFTAMGQLPALRTLRFHKAAATELFGAGVTLRDDLEDEPANLRAEMLTSLAPQISTLRLDSFQPLEAVALIRRFPHLVTLSLLYLLHGELVHQQELFSAIASARKLDNLSVTSVGVFPGWPEALAPLERDPPPIRTLQLLSVRQFGNTISQFIGILSPTVRTLTLRELPQDPDFDLTPTTPLQLPHLAHLILVIRQKHLTTALSFAVASTLSSLSLVLHDTDVDPTEPALLSFLTSQPTLSHIGLGSVQGKYPFDAYDLAIPLPPSNLAAYADLLDARGLDPSVLARRHLTPFYPTANLNYTENEAGYLEKALGRTLDFGKLELRRLVAEGNVAGAVEWVELLKPMEDKRLAWMD